MCCLEGDAEECTDGGRKVAVVEESVDVEGAEGDMDTALHTGTVRRKFFHLVPDHIPVGCNPYTVVG